MVKKILLVAPSQNAGRMLPETPSRALLILGTLAQRRGHEVKLLHADLLNGHIADELALFKPDIVAITCNTFQVKSARIIAKEAKDFGAKVILGGPHASAWSDNTIDNKVIGEGENAFLELIGEKPLNSIDDIPIPHYDLVALDRFCGIAPVGITPAMAIMASRGCPFNCLQGDTLIDTLQGMIPIKDLVGREGIKVLTRNPLTNIPEYAKAHHIAKMGENKELVKVNFDDGTYIICTPDHRFMVFDNGNQFTKVREREVEAENLKPNQSVRAIKYRPHPRFKYIEVEYGRYFRKKQQRLVIEGVLDRKLLRNELTHHKDHNKRNNSCDNLQLVSPKEHLSYHPEVAERMRRNNPMRIPSVKQRQSATLRDAVARGEYVPFMCTDEGKRIIGDIARKRALSDMNPAKVKKRERLALEVNHKVVSVEKLPYREDVYCMEVPGYDWFFANGVLVHNCTFCNTPLFWGKQVRYCKPMQVVDEVELLHNQYGINEIFFQDDTFNINHEWAFKIFEEIIRRGLNNKMLFKLDCRVNERLITKEFLDLAYKAGVWNIFYGIESGSQRMLDRMKKGITIPEIKRAVKMTHEAGIKTQCSFIVGMPGETVQTLRETDALLNEIKPTRYGWAYFCPFPNTPATEEVTAKGHKRDMDYAEYGYGKVMCRTDELSYEDLERFRGFSV